MKRNQSKFAGLFQAEPQSTPVAESEPIIIDEYVPPEKTTKKTTSTAVTETTTLDSAPVEAPANMKATKGKKSNPAYTQVTSYLTRKTYGKTRSYLWESGDSRDFSELVEDLLLDFLTKKKV